MRPRLASWGEPVGGGPDLDTGGSDGGDTGGPPPVVEDGEGHGYFLFPRWGDSPAYTLFIGTPMKDQGDAAPVPGAGEVGVLVNQGGVVLPSPGPHRVIEGSNSSSCGQDHEFVWDLQADRWFGSAFSFYMAETGPGVSYSDYRTLLVTSAPIGGANSGRVMQFHVNPCLSCAMFPRTPEKDDLLGNETSTRFGTALAVGFFEGFDTSTWLSSAVESLAVGAPTFGDAGAVHIYWPSVYASWSWYNLPWALNGSVQCDWPGGGWRERTIEGTQQGERFGTSMAVADFNCDGFDDLAVGAPAFNAPGSPAIENAGLLRIYYGGNSGIGLSGSEQFRQGDVGVGGDAEEDDQFASVLAVGNFNGRRLDTSAAWSCWDLAVGTPDEDDGAGEVQIFYGGPAGLIPGPVLRMGEDDLPGERDAGDRFGQALVGAVFADSATSSSGFHDLAIGAPGDEDGGTVIVIPASDQGQGLLLENATQLVQGDGIVDTNESGDAFGAALSRMRLGTQQPFVSDPAIVIGAPGEDGGQGAVFFVRLQEDDGFLVPNGSEVWRQSDMGMSAQAGDGFGSVLGHERAVPHRPYSQTSQVWACKVDALVASESSCSAPPVSGSCPSGHFEVDGPVPLPTVGIDTGWDGWVVEVADIDPTSSSDLAIVEAACVEACELEYEHDPHVSANCTAQDAFETPWPVVTDHRAAVAAIPSGDLDGSGLGTGQLSCSLHDDCCEAFDERLCPARPDRITTAQSQLARGEEYVVSVSGELTVMSLEEEVPEVASIVGTIGYSLCSDGNASEPCAFYLGSAHFELVQNLSFEFDCDGMPVELTLDTMEIDLLQPAMGMDFEDDDDKAFPPGALHMATHTRFNDADGLTFDAVTTSQEPVYLEASRAGVTVEDTDDFHVELAIGCHGTEPIKAWLTFETDAVVAQPPALAIDMPSSVSCGTRVPLSALATDPDDDYGPTRWIVDGVLMASSETEIALWEPHDVVAVVRDARGATATDTHTITCF